MKKRIVSFILTFSVLFSCSFHVYAYVKDKHDEIIECVLFGNANYSRTLSSASEHFKDLQDLKNATALCVDQYQGNYADLLEALQARGIHGLPKSISEIDFTFNQYHRKYTHRGWNFDYSLDDLGHWAIRKEILLQTVNHTFEFSKIAGEWGILGITKQFDYDEQCDAFAAFLYYLHVIGDFEASKSKGMIIGNVIPLVREHPGEKNEDIIWELERILPIIFKESSKTNKRLYDSLMSDLKSIGLDGRRLEGSGGMTDENFPEYHELIEKLIDKLESKVPSLLKDEPFFAKTFFNH